MSTTDVLTASLEAVEKSMLSVGSGDGTQQVAIVRRGLKNLQATFYDTQSQVLRKYPTAKQAIQYLKKECAHPPRFEVDATKLDSIYSSASFDLIFFTFPHTGVKNSDPRNIESNQRLLRSFLGAASRF